MNQTEHHREVLRLHGDGVLQGSLQEKGEVFKLQV